jgi:hypothetical protein
MNAEIDVTKIPGYNPEWSIHHAKQKEIARVNEIPAELAKYYDEDNTFTQTESPAIIRKYCCPVCWGDLEEIYIQNEARVVIACPLHGNVCTIGRIMKSSAELSMERAHFQYAVVIRNLPDLWGQFREQPKKSASVEANLRELGF